MRLCLGMRLWVLSLFYLSLRRLCFGPRVFIYLLVCMYVCIYVCMLSTFLKSYWTKLHEIFRDDVSSSKDQSFRFWERSGQRSRSRSQKGQKRIFVITRCFRPIRMEPTPKCSLFNSLFSDMVTNVALAKVCALLSGLYVCKR